MNVSKQIITRRCLPHWYVPGASHFVTYRLDGTLSIDALDQLRIKKDALITLAPKEQNRVRAHKQLFALYDSLLDEQNGPTWLADARIASMIRENLYHHHGSKYSLQAYCVMPNHVHLLFQPKEATPESAIGESRIGETEDSKSPLSKIMHSLKSYTAHEANRILHRNGVFWQSESYDHWVRDDDELERIVEYIMANPVKAGMVKNAHEWFFCSCHDRYLTDGEVSGWLRWEK